jgi:hypothetical protein
VEELRDRRGVDHADVVLGRELQEPLEPCARVLGAVALVPVGQEEREARGLLPLRAARDDELVDHDLRAVDEIAELRLPDDERVRRRDRVAVLEADGCVLGERGVVDLERRGRGRERLERRVRLPGHRVVEDGVAMRERAPLGVLAREADRDAVLEERGEGERLRVPPVDPALAECIAAALELPRELRVHLEAVGDAGELLVELAQAVRRHRCDDRLAGVRPRLRLGRRHGLRERRPQLVVRRPQDLDGPVEERGGLLGWKCALGDEPRSVRLAHGRLPVDARRLQRLRVCGLVLLVVAEAAVPDEVDDDVVAELLAVGQREPDRRERGLGIIGVHVHDRHVEPLREVARVARRAAFRGVGREADLIVRDHVQRPAGRVAVERVEVERLGDDPLPGEGGVSVDQDRERDRGVVDPGAARPVGLLGAREAHDDGVDRFQVARVRRERDLYLPRARHPCLGRREVVLHVTGAALGIGHERVDRALALELAQQRRVAAPDRVREDVEAAAVRDPDHDLVRAACGGELERLVEHRHERIQPLDRELLLADERAAQVRLERLDLRQPLEQGAALLRGWRLPEAPGLDRPSEPRALRVI